MIGLVLLGFGGIALLITLVLHFKFQPFVALLVVSIVVALAGGISVANLTKTIEDGLGGSLGHIAMIIALGAMIGRIIEESGGADAFARALIARFSGRGAPTALAIAGFFIGIPVFFEVGVIMMMPLAQVVARRGGGTLVAVGMPMCVTMLIVHALLPPHPGAVAIAGLLSADIGRVLIWGLPVAAVTALVVRVVSPIVTRGRFEAADPGSAAVFEAAAPADAPAPAVATVILLILVPIVLILVSTIASLALPPASILCQVLNLLGIPFVALLIDALACAWILGRRRGWSRDRISAVMGSAIQGVAIVILITGGGAIFAKVLVTTGIGNAVATLLQATGLPLLVVAFLLTALIRAVQGPTTVALMTVGGLIAPFAGAAHLDANHVALLCLAMGSGGIAVSHVNDAGFWIVTRLLNLDVGGGLRTWTVLTTMAGLVAFGLVSALWTFIR